MLTRGLLLTLFPRYASTMRKLSLTVGLFAALLAPALPAQQPAAVPAVEANRLVLTAESSHASVAISPAEFRALPHVTLPVHNGHTNASETYSGVPLATLLAKVNAPLDKELRGEAMMSYVIATGSDGYSVILSLAEVDSSFHEGQVLVADTRDGKPLDKNGPFQLIVSDDKRPARWVHNLNSISVQHGR